jgi:hypothetical protein
MVVSMLEESAWKNRVELKIYHLDEDPRPGEKYQPVEGGTVVIGGKKLNSINTYSFFRALEEAEKTK